MIKTVFRCDVCPLEVPQFHQQDARLPEGWQKLGAYDVCRDCAQQVMDFLMELREKLKNSGGKAGG